MILPVSLVLDQGPVLRRHATRDLRQYNNKRIKQQNIPHLLKQKMLQYKVL